MPFSDNDVITAFPELTVSLPKLGAGKQKVAYQATDGSTSVALKILFDRLDPETDAASTALERFHREMTGMRSTTCPHVVSLLSGPDVRTIGSTDHFWYTEPLLAGGTLRGRLESGPLSSAEAMMLAESLLRAVDAMWSEGGFVHRDIKPENIGYLADGTIVLIDLGIVLFSTMSPITESQVTGPGTGHYAAPEQFEIRKLAQIDFRTDLFQIGIVLAEAITGVHPFFRVGTDYWQNLNNFDVSLLDGPRIPPALKEVIPRLLAPHPSGRYRTVALAQRALGMEA